jgi:hypothetical protein
MLDIETFSDCAWATPHAVMWNRRNGRGIIYRGYGRIGCSEVIPVIVKRVEKIEPISTWGT